MNKVKNQAILVILLAIGTAGLAKTAAAQDAAALPVEVGITSANVRTMGRFDWREAAGPRCQWSASAITLRFQGTEVNAKIRDSNNDILEIVIDGKPTSVLALQKGEHLYRIAGGLTNAARAVTLFKRTEAFVGIVQYEGFQLNAGGKMLAPPAPPKHRLEVIGDSISCGYGNEGANQNEHFTPATENAYLTYGAIAARKLNADYTCVAWSGKKMWPDNTIPELYDRALPTDAGSAWDFSRQAPDAVLINLATNDFGKENPDEKGWTDAYEAFIARARKNYPKAHIYCAAGSMMSDNYPAGHHALSTLRAYLTKIVADERASGDANISFLEFDPQDGKNGIGADYHPNVKTHEIMAEKLAEALTRDLKWK
jgi:lysophospholipase L1-like esterase